MRKSIYRRYFLLLSSFLLSIYLLAPGFWERDEVPSFFRSKGLNLGLDLQGGIHLTLRVAVEEAIKKAAESRAVSLESRLKEEGITLSAPPKVELDGDVARTTFTFASAEDARKARKIFEDYNPSIRIEEGDGSRLIVRGDEVNAERLRQSAVDRALEILRGRIDTLGVAEPVLVREGEDRIVVQLPGLDNEEEALKLIGTTAQLEFKIVHDDDPVLQRQVAKARAEGLLNDDSTREDFERVLKDYIPPDAELGFMIPIREKESTSAKNLAKEKGPLKPILLRSRTEMTGEGVVNAYVARDPMTNQPYVALSLSPSAARDFERLTAANVDKRLAIVLDGIVKSAPNINEKIAGGQVSISGGFTDLEASTLSLILRSGALPAPIKVIENITVGPSLGRDSVNAGLRSAILGFILVCLFMGIYYRLSGWIADAALLLNNFLLLGCLSAMGATLTLPGIAGIVLTMGMAVDSNVLIFERIREELDLGVKIPSAIRAGFDKAWWTIIDSHVTTLITAFVLFRFGSGPIKGFAITLSVGVLLNLFTALVGTKVVYDHLLMNSKIKRLKFRQLIEKPNMDFIKFRRPAFLISGLLVTLGIVGLVQIQRGHANLGIDFAGGTMVTLESSKPVSIKDARDALGKAGFEEVEVQVAAEAGQVLIRLKNDEEGEPGVLSKKILSALTPAFPDNEIRVIGTTVIGSAISADLRNTSISAIILSLIGIIFYLTLRFDFRYGVAAAMATFHDVLVVLGFFWLTGKTINLLLVTALLTLAGYSLTDTVVVFDRLREVRSIHPSLGIGDVVNRGVNEVLSRTLVTTATVLLVLLALYFFGGSVLNEFSLALLLGVLVGNYSSVFVASPILYEWETRYGRLSEGDAGRKRASHSPTEAKA